MHIRQRGPADCGIAAIAMFTGRTYEEVDAIARSTGAYHPKRGTSCCGRILERLGYHWENLGRHPDHPAPNPSGRQFQSLRFSWSGVKSSFVAQLLWGRPTLISMVSLNHGHDDHHLVYFDGRRVLDPQEGRRGKKFATALAGVEIEEVWIWQEGKTK